MTKWKRVFTIACSVIAVTLIVLAVLVYVPRTTELDYDMRGFIISPDGEVLEEFPFTMYGKEYNFIIDRPGGGVRFTGGQEHHVTRDAFVLRFDWGDASFAPNCKLEYMLDFHRRENTQMFTVLDYYDPTTNESYSEGGLLDLEDKTLCIYADHLVDDAFIVGLTDPEGDPHAVIDTFLKHRKIPSEFSPEENGGKPLSWDLNGTFVLSGCTTDAVNFTVDGYVYDNEDRIDVLDITLAFPDNFRYTMSSSNLAFTSVNQKNNDLPHLMIFSTAVLDKQTYSYAFTYFAFDLEKKYIAVMFESTPDCYLVASADPSVAHTELLKHFADFMESYSLD